MATQSGLNILTGFQVSAYSPIDTRYLYFGNTVPVPYASTSSAIASNPYYRYQGLTVLIGTQSNPQEYWWQNGTSDSQLVLKQSGGTGNITGSASNGYVTLWTGTTSIGYTSSLYWDNPTNGLLVGSNLAYGTHSLQVTGGVHFRNSGTNSIGIDIYSSSTNNYTALYSNSYRSAFQFSNLKDYTYLKGSMDNGDSVFVIYDTSNSCQSTNTLRLTAQPQTSNGGTGSFKLLTFTSYPSNDTLAIGSSLDQQYYYRDITQYNLGYTVSCYRPLGLYGVIYESGTFSNEESSFRWQNMVSGNLSETMRLSGTNLLIGYSESQGTYSLQVNGDAYINGLTVGRGKTNIISNTIIGNKTAGNLISTSAVNNVFIGYQAAYTISGTYGSTGNNNVVIGANAGYNLQGYENTLIGQEAGNSLTYQYGVVCVGFQAGYNDNAGALPSYNQNTYVGHKSGQNNVSGQNNTFLGSLSGMHTTGGNNTFVGSSAGFSNTLGTNNVGIGSGVVVIGSNIIAIGYNVSATVSNTVIIGNSSITSTTLYGNVSTNGSITAQTGGFDSDARLKSDIVYNPVIEGIDTIRSASYVIGGNSHIGYIAQEVQNIVPSSIIKKDDGYLALNYNEVLVAKVAFLENKVKELSDIIERNGLK